MERDNRLDVIRVIAMLMIVSCHYFQIIGAVGIASWLNSGVQIFFLVSAFLLSNRSFSSICEVREFLKRRLIRIMIPIWIYLAFISVVLLVMRQPLKPSAVVLYSSGLAAFSKSGLLGLGHLWYVTAVLICYSMVPILDFLLKKMDSKIWRGIFLAIVSAFWIGLFQAYSYLAYGIDIAFFAVMICVFKSQRHQNPDRWLMSISWFPAILLSGLRIIVEICPFAEALRQTDIFEGVITLSKCFLAVLLFSLLRCCFICKSISPIMQYFSRISYEVYITHQFILLVVSRIVSLCGFRDETHDILMAVISIPLIIANAVILNKTADYAKRKIDKVVGTKVL